MDSEHVERRDHGYWLAGTRVSLDSLVHAFLKGQTAESIAHCFPVLRLEQVQGAITYYLAHREEIDHYLQKAGAEYEALRQASRTADPTF